MSRPTYRAVVLDTDRPAPGRPNGWLRMGGTAPSGQPLAEYTTHNGRTVCEAMVHCDPAHASWSRAHDNGAIGGRLPTGAL